MRNIPTRLKTCASNQPQVNCSELSPDVDQLQGPPAMVCRSIPRRATAGPTARATISDRHALIRPSTCCLCSSICAAALDPGGTGSNTIRPESWDSDGCRKRCNSSTSESMSSSRVFSTSSCSAFLWSVMTGEYGRPCRCRPPVRWPRIRPSPNTTGFAQNGTFNSASDSALAVSTRTL